MDNDFAPCRCGWSNGQWVQRHIGSHEDGYLTMRIDCSWCGLATPWIRGYGRMVRHWRTLQDFIGPPAPVEQFVDFCVKHPSLVVQEARDGVTRGIPEMTWEEFDELMEEHKDDVKKLPVANWLKLTTA